MRCEQGRVAYEQAWHRWQQLEQQRQQEMARAQEEHEFATANAHEQHQHVMELEKDSKLDNVQLGRSA